MKTIKYGSSGEEVKLVQTLLGGLIADGVFGKLTQAAVVAFQSANGLVADGIVGPLTWEKLLARTPSEEIPDINMPTLTRGSTGDDVKFLQQILGNLTADGIFGEKTYAAVVAYQKAHGILANGIVNAYTWQLLLDEKPAEPSVTILRPPDYKQFDSRWGNLMFSSHGDRTQTIRSSACGPTSMADVVAHWWDSKITPVEMCQFAIINGYREYEGGVSGEFFGAVAKSYGASKVIRSGNIATATSCLDKGGLVVVCFGPGRWTSGGHFCLLWNYKNNIFSINDPGSSSKSKETGTYAEVRDQARGYWCIFK